MSDRQIIGLIRDKDPDGLAQLEEMYGSFIRYIVNSVLAPFPEEIDECINDLRLKFWDILPEYDPAKASLKTYIARVTRNTALNRLKARQRQDQHIEPGELSELTDQASASEANPTEAAILRQEQKEQLNQALRKLLPGERDLFLRKYYYLQTTDQIAAETDLSRRAVESRLARIKKKLAKALKEVT